MNVRFVFEFCLYLCAILYGIRSCSVFELFSENERIGNTIASYDMKSAHECLILCDKASGCSSVNYHYENKRCLLSDHYPENGTSVRTPESGWKIYYRRKTAVNLSDGAVAWSIKNSQYADKVIDGVTKSYPTITTSCFLQKRPLSYWAVEFGTTSLVTAVDLYLYSLNNINRNKGFTVSVGSTRDDVINDTATECGRYDGAPVSEPPFVIKIDCHCPIYGKFLKIQHTIRKYMQLCEVVVYTSSGD